MAMNATQYTMLSNDIVTVTPDVTVYTNVTSWASDAPYTITSSPYYTSVVTS